MTHAERPMIPQPMLADSPGWYLRTDNHPRLPAGRSYQLGFQAGLRGTMKGLPYGPGGRQDTYTQGYYDALADALSGRVDTQP